MVGGTTHQPQQAPQLAPTAPATTPEEEELLKRNTDCVYFLASPLTCKKGSECEYRHSDIARVNPRDCWYWLNGNCLNPKCGFRHPPLDGLLGVDALTPMGPSVTQLHTPVTSAVHATPYAMPKQGVACIFFQKGFCLKGHLCPFLHGPPNPVNNKSSQSGPVNRVTEPPKMAYSGPEKPIQEQKFTQQATIQKPVEFLLPLGKQAPRMQAPPPARNDGGGAIDRKVPPPTSMGVKEPPPQKSTPVMNEMLPSKRNCGVYQANHVSDNNRILNGKDADEYSREPSPGFDVLVDNELGDSEYYHNEDEFGRSRGHSFDVGHPAEYDVARDMHQEREDYDHYSGRDRLQEGQYVWEDRRISPERKLVGLAHLERKSYPRSASPNHFDESDLRYRISKQRRGSDIGLRSVVSHDYHRRPADQGVLSGRLRGRIKIPGRSMSPTNENDSRVERATDMGRKPGRPPHTSFYQSRIRDYKGSHGCRDIISDLDTKFTGPKRLSELKRGRTVEGHEHQMNDRQALGKRKHPKVESQPSADDLSFEGPKPLSEILKRKRGAETRAVDNQKEREIIISGSTGCTNKEDCNSVSAIFEPAEKQTGANYTEKDKSVDRKSSLNQDARELGIEEGLIDEDAILDQELEAYDHRGGDYDYEQIDGEDYNLEEGDNPDEEYVDEDEYVKKESIVYS